MDIRKDIMGREPKIGDTIAFNPPRYKGLLWGKCVKFTSVGLPILKMDEDDDDYFITPKTGFAIIKKPEENGY